ncbi:MAG: hypothetical protein N4A33_00665 [Bacteriovoracaceae bacterium]|jgi:chorismate mutase|nr:hypothetical protein [Bacteriovoracaceae bacterium]
MSRLEQRRSELEDIGIQLFSLLENRKLLVSQIQELKDVSSSFDVNREKVLFSNQKSKLLKLSLQELLAYSLIIESHAYSFNGTYPKWSEQVHLASQNQTIESRINPVLLALYDKKRYDSLQLNEEFSSKLGNLDEFGSSYSD